MVRDGGVLMIRGGFGADTDEEEEEFHASSSASSLSSANPYSGIPRHAMSLLENGEEQIPHPDKVGWSPKWYNDNAVDTSGGLFHEVERRMQLIRQSLEDDEEGGDEDDDEDKNKCRVKTRREGPRWGMSAEEANAWADMSTGKPFDRMREDIITALEQCAPCPRATARCCERPPRDEACPISTGGGTRRVHLVRGEGRDVSC